MATLTRPRAWRLAIVPRPERIVAWVTTTDHKRIGLLYLVTTALFLGLGGLEALAMRVQLATPRASVLSPATYNALFTAHGTTMIFLAITPMLIGFANYFVPLMIGARDMAFPRLNALTGSSSSVVSSSTSASPLAARPTSVGSPTPRSPSAHSR